jgi:ribosome recycling factor
MAAPSFTSFPRRTFPQPHPWPDSIRQDQRAIEQARQELGPDADAKAILVRAQQIARESREKAVKRG